MSVLISGITSITLPQVVMMVLGGVLIFLAIKKDMEPALLLPMGFGAILVNLPLSGVLNQVMPGIGRPPGSLPGCSRWESRPRGAALLLFIGIGAMIDFGPVLSNPRMLLFGAAAQFGIFLTFAVATLLGFDLKDSASIAIIGTADGPTAILVANIFEATIFRPLPWPLLIWPLSPSSSFRHQNGHHQEGAGHEMEYNPKGSPGQRILFPIIVTIVAGLVAPASIALVGFLMFGNLIRECGKLDTLSKTAQNVLANLVTLFLGITISFKMQAAEFLTIETLLIMLLGLFAFVFDSISGVIFAKLLNLFVKSKINPMVGVAVFRLPMSAGRAENGSGGQYQNHLLMHAVGANVAGQIASVVAGSIILAWCQPYSRRVEKMFANYSWDAAWGNFLDSLQVMGLGMLGIFLVIGVIYAAVNLLAVLTKE